MRKKYFIAIILLVFCFFKMTHIVYSRAKAKRKVVAFCCVCSAPYLHVNDGGSPDGFDIDIFKAVVAVSDIEAEIEANFHGEFTEDSESDKYDVLIGVHNMPRLRETRLLTIPYAVKVLSLFAREDSLIESFKECKTKEVLVTKGTFCHSYLKEHGVSKIIPVKSCLDAFRLLSKGKHDIVLAASLHGDYMINKYSLTNLKRLDIPVKSVNTYLAVKKGDVNLLSMLNRGFAHIKSSGEYTRIYDKWFGARLPYEEMAMDRILRYLGTIFIALFIFFVVSVSLSLKGQVMHKSSQLEEELVWRKKTENILRNTERRYRAFMEHSNEGIWCCEVDKPIRIDLKPDEQIEMFYKHGTLVECNDVMASMMVFSSAEKICATPLNLTYPPTKNQIKYLQKWISSGYQLLNTEVKICDKTGCPRVYSNSFVGVVENGKLLRAWGVQRDITDHKKTENEREQLLIVLSEKNRELENINTELDSFVYTASHDLRSPLSIISSYLSIIKEEHYDRLDDEAKFLFTRIYHRVKLMDKIIEDLLTLSRISRVESSFEDVDIKELIESQKDRINYQGNEDRVKLVFQANIPQINCDKIKMAEAFFNLINNAIKFSHKNSKDDIIVEIGYKDNTVCHEFYVKDNGIGISPEYHEKIFGFFERLYPESEYEGTGVGLSIVKKIVESLGGEIWVESDLNKGAVFRFMVPKNV